MAEPNDHESNIFGHGFERCPETNRPYESGHGALSKAAQTQNFIRERDQQQRQAALDAPAPAAPPASKTALR
jgi:hypothetical protein